MKSGYHEHLNAFVTIAKSRSLTRASAVSGAGQSTLSRQLAALEKHLGCRLLHRSTRSVKLTEKGEIFLPHAERILQAAADAKELLREGRSGFSGRLRVSCSIAVARRLLIPALPRWQALHPELCLELDISDRFANLVEDQVDVALRAGALSNSSLIGRPIAHTPRIAVASCEYLRGRAAPQEPEDLKRHECIVFAGAARPQQWEFDNGRRTLGVKVPSRLSVSTVDALYDAVRAGLGIGLIPSWFCKNALSDGSFVRVLSGYRLPTLTMHAVTLAKPAAGGKIQAFVQFAERLFKDSLA